MNQTQNTVRVGLFVILGLALIWVTYTTLGQSTSLSNKGYELVAGFPDLKSLKTGDDVRMAGVRIGLVDSTRLGNGRGEAILRIDPTVKIANDSIATIASAGLLGTNYITLTLGTPGALSLAPKSELKTRTSADLNTIMEQIGALGAKLESSLNSMGAAFESKDGQPNLFERLNTLIADNGDKVSATMTNLQEITEKANHGDGTLGKLLNDDQLHTQLVAAVTEIKAAAQDARTLVNDAQGMMTQAKTGKGALNTLLYDETSAAELRNTIANLNEVSEKLANGKGTLGQLINDDSILNDARNTLNKANKALDSMGDSGPITAVGVVGNALF